MNLRRGLPVAVVAMLGVGAAACGSDAEPISAGSSAAGWSEAAGGSVRGRVFPSIVWTGSEYVVWGGEKPSETDWHATGAAFDPVVGRWRELAVGPLSPRSEHVAVWTGREMLVCCGRIVGPGADAAGYEPAADAWRVIASPPFDAAFAEAVWTGEEMIVFGGVTGGGAGQSLHTAAYDPDLDAWRVLADLPYALERSAEAVYADGGVFAWPSAFGAPAARGLPLFYDIAADAWTPMPPPPADASPITPSLVWTGDQLVAWGLAEGSDQARGVGVAFDPGTRSWTALPPPPLEPTDPSEGTQASQAAAWTGQEMIVWTGWIGTDGDAPFSRVLSLNPRSLIWSELPPAPVPAQGMWHEPLVWTGTQLIAYTDPPLVYTPPR